MIPTWSVWLVVWIVAISVTIFLWDSGEKGYHKKITRRVAIFGGAAIALYIEFFVHARGIAAVGVNVISMLVYHIIVAVVSLNDSATKVQPRKISHHRVSSTSVAFGFLYFQTLLVEFVSFLIRFVITALGLFLPFIGLGLVLAIISIETNFFIPNYSRFGEMVGSWLVAWFWTSLLISAFPLLMSLFSWIIPANLVSLRRQLGAREPTRKELARIESAILNVMRNADGEQRVHAVYSVLDSPYPNAYTISGYLFLSSALFDEAEQYLEPAIAHEVGHLNHGDGSKLLALRRLVIPLAYWFGVDRQLAPQGLLSSQRTVEIGQVGGDQELYYRMKTIRMRMSLAILFGGLGLIILGQEWAEFWRDNDYHADQIAADLGYRERLLSFLHDFRNIDLAQPFSLNMRAYTALRIDRLEFEPTNQRATQRTASREKKPRKTLDNTKTANKK